MAKRLDASRCIGEKELVALGQQDQILLFWPMGHRGPGFVSVPMMSGEGRLRVQLWHPVGFRGHAAKNMFVFDIH